MADRYTSDGDVEAEPIIGSVHGSTFRLELDDGQVLEILIADVVAAMAMRMDVAA